MSQRRFVLWTICLGITVPALYLILERVFMKDNPGLSYLVVSTYRLDYVILALWPSSILLMADPEGRSISIPLFAISANVVLYAVVGWSVWVGLNRRSILFIFVAACLLAAGYYLLFRWYAGF